MKRASILLIFLTSLFALDENSFITKYEYGAMLFENPRGIGCNKCHGDDAKGKLIATYMEKNETKELRAPAINEINYIVFKEKLTKRNRSKVMPTYFLTNEELESIYYYIKNIKKK